MDSNDAKRDEAAQIHLEFAISWLLGRNGLKPATDSQRAKLLRDLPDAIKEAAERHGMKVDEYLSIQRLMAEMRESVSSGAPDNPDADDEDGDIFA